MLGPLAEGHASARDSSEAAEGVRFQLGQSDRFREGVRALGRLARAHRGDVREAWACRRELAALPHVESSFNTYAYSKVGAAGMWQFMRGTGRRFLRIDASVDERLDPYRSTEAAARFLEQNYIVLGSWPLALTAYNHGTARHERAQEQLGTDDIARSSASTTAARSASPHATSTSRFSPRSRSIADPEKFFGPIRRNPTRFQSRPRRARTSCRRAVLPHVLDARSRRTAPTESVAVAVCVARRASRAAGFELRVPNTSISPQCSSQHIGGERYEAQVAETQHRVRSGESLSRRSRRATASSISALAETQQPRSPYRIRAGQVLALPARRCT